MCLLPLSSAAPFVCLHFGLLYFYTDNLHVVFLYVHKSPPGVFVYILISVSLQTMSQPLSLWSAHSLLSTRVTPNKNLSIFICTREDI